MCVRHSLAGKHVRYTISFPRGTDKCNRQRLEQQLCFVSGFASHRNHHTIYCMGSMHQTMTQYNASRTYRHYTPASQPSAGTQIHQSAELL